MTDYKVYTLSEATKKMERYCAYQERCHKEVATKLREIRMIPDAIDQIIVYLIQENYLNEERFVQSYVRGKFNIKKWGKRRIKAELKRRNISDFLIRTALKEIDDHTYQESLNNLIHKKLATLKETNTQKRKRKLADYLLYRGWESHLVYDKINEFVK